MSCYKFERDISGNSTLCMYSRLCELCYHIGALLFKLEAAVRTGFTKKKGCIEIACLRNQDFVNKIKPGKIANIKIYSQKAIDNTKNNIIFRK